MKNFKILLFGILFFSCRSKDDSIYFKGNLIHIDISSKVDTLEGNIIKLEEEHYGLISVYDSLIFFSNPMDRQYQFRCYNHITGKHLANFFPIGRGHEEFMNVSPIHHTFNCGDTIKSIFVAANEEKMGLFNISQSILNKRTVLEDLSDFKWKKSFLKPLTTLYPLGDRIVGYIHGGKSLLENSKNTLPHYIYFDKTTMDIIDTVDIYNEVLNNILSDRVDSKVLGFFTALKPDGTKMVNSMSFLQQINILNIETGEIKGIRFGQKTLLDLIDNPEEVKMYHMFFDVDDDYIYVPMFADGMINKGANIINVFSWDGDYIAQYYIKEAFDQIQIEPKSNKLFTYNQFTSTLYCYGIPSK